MGVDFLNTLSFSMDIIRDSPGPLTPSPTLSGTSFFFQDSMKGLEEHGESWPSSESLWTMDHDKAEDGVRRLWEAKGTFLKVLLRSNLWNPVKTIHFLYGPLRSLKDMEVPDKAGNGIRGPGEPLGSYTKNFVKLGQQVPC